MLVFGLLSLAAGKADLEQRRALEDLLASQRLPALAEIRTGSDDQDKRSSAARLAGDADLAPVLSAVAAVLSTRYFPMFTAEDADRFVQREERWFVTL